jgi:hypothetical protein
MPQRRALFLDANRITAYAWQGGRIQSEGYFAGDVPGLEAFSAYLKTKRSSLFYLLADVAEEGYQIEDIPFVQGNDRKALIERRLSQYFYGTPLATAVSLGRDKTGRRDEKMLFSALTRPQFFEPWLATLRQSETRLAGVFSVPLILAPLYAGLSKGTGRFLLLSLSKSGLRQTFFQDGQLRFSRLTPLVTSSIEEFPVACATEATKIYQYLVGQRQVERGNKLDTLILAHPAEFTHIRERCRNNDELRFDVVDMVQLADKAGLKSALPDSHAEPLLLHTLLRKTPPVQLAPEAERRFFRLWQWRTALNSLAGLILVSCLLFAGKNYLQSYNLQQEVVAIKADAATAKQRYDAVLKTLPPMPVTADQLRAMVARFDELEKHSPTLQGTLSQISGALERSPLVELQQISWRTTDRPSDVQVQAAKPVAGAPLMPSGSGVFFVVTSIQAQLPVSISNDHRAILSAVEQFVDELKKKEGLTVIVQNMPFDLASGKTIKSSGNDAEVQVEPPKFSVRLVQPI